MGLLNQVSGLRAGPEVQSALHCESAHERVRTKDLHAEEQVARSGLAHSKIRRAVPDLYQDQVVLVLELEGLLVELRKLLSSSETALLMETMISN